MQKDHNHDLVHAITKKNDAVWRYQKYYLKTSQGCEHCTSLWNKLIEDDNKHIEMLKEEIERHVKEGRFD